MSTPPFDSPGDPLLPRLRAGEADAWRLAFTRLWPRAHRVAHAVLGDAHLAEDAAAEVLRDLTAHPERVRTWPELEAYVLVCVRRRAISMQRDARAAKRGGGDLVPLDENIDATTPDEVALAALDLAALLPTLDPLRRRIVEEHFLQGRTSDDIGARLDLNPATVRSHLARALRQLQERVNPSRDETAS